MESIRRLIPLIFSFLFVTVALASYALGLGEVIEKLDMKIMEQSLLQFNWLYSH
jgi:hypothetical protein